MTTSKQPKYQHNPNCPCPLKDKSQCFLAWAVITDYPKKGMVKEGYMDTVCPHYSKVSREAMAMFKKL